MHCNAYSKQACKYDQIQNKAVACLVAEPNTNSLLEPDTNMNNNYSDGEPPTHQ